jgi:2-oxoglutarate dehydrogenase E2 component (dihydrolipoamide succinyltransferase)
MAEYNLLMPKMGESVIEATILTWHKNVGDKVNEHDVILEVATDKVDSEVPSPVSGVLKKILYDVNVAVGVGEPLAIIEVEGDAPAQYISEKKKTSSETEEVKVEKTADSKTEKEISTPEPEINQVTPTISSTVAMNTEQPQISNQKYELEKSQQSASNKYYSPLVLNIAQVENVSMQELETINGTGAENRVTKEDILAYVELKKSSPQSIVQTTQNKKAEPTEIKLEKSTEKSNDLKSTTIDHNSNIEIIEMDRMRKLISQHMTNSSKNICACFFFCRMRCDQHCALAR